MSVANENFTLPTKEIDISYQSETVISAVNKLYPRQKDYMDARYTIEEFEAAESNTEYHIPDHQRFYVWSKKQQNDLIDTLLRGYPIPDIIISTTSRRGDPKEIEDGQQRLTTLWRYMHNLFPYTPLEYIDHPNSPLIYYSDIPTRVTGNTKSLDDMDPDAKRRLEEYSLKIKLITNYGPESLISKISDIFERLNSGKSLADGDKLWNRKDKLVVARAIQMGQDEDTKGLLLSVFKLDISKIMTSTGKAIAKTPLCTLVGLILGLTFPREFDFRDDKKHWPDVMTTSFPKICAFLDMEITDTQYDNAIIGLKTICQAIRQAPTPRDSNRISCKHNASFNRHLGVMVYDWREETSEYEDLEEGIPDDAEEITRYSERWRNIIGDFQDSEDNLDDHDHPITGMYINGDRKNKNTDIGKNIIQRHGQIQILYNQWFT